MFLVYINSLLDGRLSGAVTAYADDVTLLYIDDSISGIEVRMREDMERIREWLDSHGMQMSQKTVIMEFGTRLPSISAAVCHAGACLRTTGSCLSDCIRIERVDQYKYLGVVLDSSLKWSAHVGRVREGLRAVCRQMFALRNCCSPDLLRAFYFALGESRLRYGLIFWGGACDTRIQPLAVAQKYIIRAMSFAGWREHSAPLFARWNILPLRSLYILRVADAYFGRHMNFGSYFRGCSRDSRKGELLEVPRPTTEAFRRTFNFLAPLVVNNLNAALQDLSGDHVRAYLSTIDQDAVRCLLASRYV